MASRETFKLLLEVARAPKVTIRCFGDSNAKMIWNGLTKRHAKFPLFRAKTFGAALRKLPLANEILEGSHLTLMRRKVRKAANAGFTFRKINPSEHFDEILEINNSSGERQGRPLSANYTVVSKVQDYNAQTGDWFGVFDSSGKLQAYTHAPITGDVYIFSRILGNAAMLNDGIMYFLVAETMQAMAQRRDAQGSPNWAMYDMYIGGGNGLREFKLRTGFAPMRVDWKWEGN